MENDIDTSVSKTKKYIQTAGLLFILLVLPLGSWFYLSSGLNYQKAARAELKDYGAIPDMAFSDQNDQTISKDSLLGNMLLVSFFRFDDVDNPQRFKILKALHEQFDDRPKVSFVQYALSPVPGGGATLKSFAKTMQLEDEGQCMYLHGSMEQVYRLLREGYHFPKEGLLLDAEGKIQLMPELPQGLKDYPYFVLVDDKGLIRNYYDYREPGQMKRLVEHMALLMPR